MTAMEELTLLAGESADRDRALLSPDSFFSLNMRAMKQSSHYTSRLFHFSSIISNFQENLDVYYQSVSYSSTLSHTLITFLPSLIPWARCEKKGLIFFQCLSYSLIPYQLFLVLHSSSCITLF